MLSSTSRRLVVVAGQYNVRTFSAIPPSPAPPAPSTGSVPDSIKRVGVADEFPNEYPGQVYAFNWCLNGEGVTPLRKSAFRITKPLDLKVAGLDVPKTMPLKVKAAANKAIFEAGSDDLTFEDFDKASQETRDWLSLSDHLYCPEGLVPGTLTAVRCITNSATLAPALVAFLERGPRKEPPTSLPITVYVLENDAVANFAGYAIEEVEVEVPDPEADAREWVTGDEPEHETEPKSVAAVVVAGASPQIDVIVAGLEASQKALAADELERIAKKEAEEHAAKQEE